MEKRSGAALGILFGGLFLALFGFLFLAFSVATSGREGTSAFSKPGGAVGVLEIQGVIEDSQPALKALRQFSNDERVKALLVRVDSPGGAVAPSQEIFSELRKLSESMHVVCSMGDMAASGGLYIAVGCEEIFANPGTLTGSIGVIAQMPYLGGLAELLKFRMETVKSGALKDMGNPFREMTEVDRKYFQEMLDSVHRQFIEAVAEGRGKPVEEIAALADGRVLTGQMAHEAGLVDALGNFNDALYRAAELAGIEGEPQLVYPEEPKVFPFEFLMREGARSMVRGVRDEILSPEVASGRSGRPLLMAPISSPATGAR